MKKVNIVMEAEMTSLIYAWQNKTSEIPYEKYLAQDFDDQFIAVDNTSGELFMEEFDDLLDAVKWLYEIEDEEEENQPPNVIQKGALFASIADLFYRTLSADTTPKEAAEMLFISLDIALKKTGCDIKQIFHSDEDN